MMKQKHILYCLLLCAGHYVYTLCFPSIINGERFIGSSYKVLEPSYIHAFFLSRLKFGEFARRPLTTFFIQAMEKIGVPLEYAFLAVLYTGLFLTLLLLFRLSLKLTSSTRAAYWSTAIFITSFWVIHAFFAEIYAYDEPWQYVFVFAALEFLRQKKWLLFSGFFFMALIARESTLLLLPGIFFFFMLEPPVWSRANLLRLVKVAWTVPAYGLFLWFWISGRELGEKSSSYMRDIRFKHLYYSFADLDIGIDTLTSFVMALVVPATLWHLNRRIRPEQQDNPWTKAFILNFGINTFITFIFTMGRETRIFAQPVLMLSPFLGLYLLEISRHFKLPFGTAFSDPMQFGKWLGYGLFFAAFCFAISLFAYEVYWPTDTRFFSGFQHHVYLTLCICTGLFLSFETRSPDVPFTFKNSLPFLLMLSPMALFFGNQKGYRAYDIFEPAKTITEQLNSVENREHFLVVATNIPGVAKNYFDAQEVPALTGDFNFQLPVKQFLYKDETYSDRNLLYMELEAARNFPFRYILSQYGRAEKVVIRETPGLLVHTDERPVLEPYTFRYEPDSGKFKPATPEPFKDHDIQLSEEYTRAFRVTLGELGIDSLYSFAAKVDFNCEMSSEAAIVVTVDRPGGEGIWEHEFLNIFLVDPEGWNTAYKGVAIDPVTDSSAQVSFYVWNPKMDRVKLRNLEIVLNSQWMPEPKERRSVTTSRELK